MAREEVSFARGSKATIPSDKVPGRLLVATDTGEAYVDDTTNSRVQLKDSTKVSKSGDTMTGPLNMGSNKITNVATPTADTDAANLGSVKSETAKVKYTGGTAITVDDSDKTISHNNIGTAGSVGPSANATPAPGSTFNVPQITTDAQGHVSSKTNRTVKIPQYSAGTGLSISGTAISHTNNGTAGSYGPTDNVTPGYGGTFQIPQITTNAQGHVTAITMRTVTLPSAQDIPDVETYTGVPPITVSGTQISHDSSVTAGNKGPTGNSTVSPGGTFTVPQIYYDAYGHVTSSTANRTLTLNPSILDTGDILTSLSGVSSNTKVLGAKLVADAINNLNRQVSTLNTNHSKDTEREVIYQDRSKNFYIAAQRVQNTVVIWGDGASSVDEISFIIPDEFRPQSGLSFAVFAGSDLTSIQIAGYGGIVYSGNFSINIKTDLVTNSTRLLLSWTYAGKPI